VSELLVIMGLFPGRIALFSEGKRASFLRQEAVTVDVTNETVIAGTNMSVMTISRLAVSRMYRLVHTY